MILTRAAMAALSYRGGAMDSRMLGTIPFDRLDDERLVREYREGMRHCFNAMFGRNACIQQNEIARELFRRGIREIPSIFGPIEIVDNWSK